MNPNNQQPQQPVNPIDTPEFDQAARTVSAAINGQPAPAVQPPAAAPAPTKSITIKFEEDLQFEVTSDVIDDMRFMELYAEVSEDQLKITKLIKFLLGEAQYESIFTYYESKGQRFTITKFGQVFEQLDKDLNANPDFLSR